MKRNMNLIWSGCLAFLACCTSGGSEFGSETHFIKSVAIVDAEALIVGDLDIDGEQAGDGRSRLFKFTEDGVFSVVRYFDEEGQELSIESPPSRIENVNATFVLLVFGEGAGTISADAEAILVRKSDGAAFSLGQGAPFVPRRPGGHFYGWPSVLDDRDGQLYYLASTNDPNRPQVMRVDTSDAGELKREALTPTQDDIHRFSVSSDGVVIYRAFSVSLQRTVVRIRHHDQSLETRPDIADFFRGTKELYVKTATPTAGWSTVSAEGEDAIALTPYATDAPAVDTEFARRLIFPGHLILVSGGKPVEWENPEGKVKQIDIPLQEVRRTVASDDAYYLSGFDADFKSNIIRVNPSDDIPVSLLTPGEFEVSALDASADNILRFEALRLSDSATVLGEIAADGTVSFHEQRPFNGQVTILERIR